MDRRKLERPSRECVICKTKFKRTVLSGNRLSKARACSPECRKKLFANKKLWTPAEEAFIREHANDLPWIKFYAEFKRRQTMNGWPPRTERAFARHVYAMGFDKQPRFVMVQVTQLARLLGISREVPTRWVKQGLAVGYRNPSNGYTYISFKEVRRFAQIYPHKFAGIKYKNLLTVLDDEEFCRHIVDTYPKRSGCKRPVLCITTGKKYESATQAAKQFNVVRQAITRACRLNATCCGYRFKYID